jgi:hypothetical protein
MKTHISDMLQIVAAIVITGGLVASAAPLPTPSQASITSDVTANKKVVTPVKQDKPVVSTPVPVVTAKWEDNPNHCDQNAQYISKDAPFNCIDKPVAPAAVAPVAVAYSGSHMDLLAAAGIAPEDFFAADYIVMHEGHYDPCVVNGGAVDCSYAINGGQKAYGVCQALPGSKMASAGADWATNPVTQLRWCASYAQTCETFRHYCGWQGAYQYWISHSNW